MISFIIPAKDEEHYILDCIRSVYREAADEKFEIIVVDNNCVDNTVSRVKKFFPEVRIVKEPIAGTNSARQRGFLESRGEVLAYLDADVRLPAGWLKKVLKKINSSEKIVAVSGLYRYYDFTWYWNLVNDVWTILVLYPWCYVMIEWSKVATQMIGGNMVIKKAALEKIGGFDPVYKFYGDDTGTAEELVRVGRVIFHPRFWVYSSARRYNKAGIIKTTVVYLLNYFWIMFTRRPYSKGEVENIR